MNRHIDITIFKHKVALGFFNLSIMIWNSKMLSNFPATITTNVSKLSDKEFGKKTDEWVVLMGGEHYDIRNWRYTQHSQVSQPHVSHYEWGVCSSPDNINIGLVIPCHI